MKGWFDSPIESLKAAYNEAVQKWQAALQSLDFEYEQFMQHRDYALSDDELAPRWNDLNGKIDLLQTTIQGVKDAIDTIADFFAGIGEAVGLSGGRTMQGLGALPALPWAWVAVITAGTATVWALVNSVHTFNVDAINRQISEQNVIRAQRGEAPLPFVDLDPPGGGFMAGLSSTAKWAVIGLLGIMAFKAYSDNQRWLT